VGHPTWLTCDQRETVRIGVILRQIITSAVSRTKEPFSLNPFIPLLRDPSCSANPAAQNRKETTWHSFHIDGTSAADIIPIIRANVAKETAMMTDEGGHYFTLGDHFASHESVSHKADEYVRGNVHTNTVEGYYSVFKRGMKGVYQHCSEKHLHRYLSEFDFRYSNRSAIGVEDAERVTKIAAGITGMRLTYRRTNEARL
jgi:hypothetical protein